MCHRFTELHYKKRHSLSYLLIGLARRTATISACMALILSPAEAARPWTSSHGVPVYLPAYAAGANILFDDRSKCVCVCVREQLVQGRTRQCWDGD